MKLFAEIFGMLAFRERALRMQVERRASIAGMLLFCIGFLVYSIVRNSAYSAMPETARQFAPDASLLDSGLVQVLLLLVQWLLFLLTVYIPVLIFWGDLFAGEQPSFSNARRKYRSHISALFPLWGVLFIVAAPLQWFILFIPIKLPAKLWMHLVPMPLPASIYVDISFALLVLLILLFAYTLWAIKQLSGLPFAQSVGVFASSWFTFVFLLNFKSW